MQLSNHQFQIISAFKEETKDNPLTKIQLLSTLKKLQLQFGVEISNQTKEEINNINIVAIEKQFVGMMQQVFKAIQGPIKQYRNHRSINYLDQIIIKSLDPKIYHKGYQLHKHKETPMAKLLEKEDEDVCNKIFSEIFDIMNQLMLTMKIYYGYDNQDSISEALYESISTFVEQNENCFLVQQDRRSYIEQQEKQKEKKKKGNDPAPYDILVDVLNAIDKDKANLSTPGFFNKAQNLLSVIYKYAIAPTIDYTYQKIKNINPLATNKKLSAQEQLNLRLSLIDHLSPHLSIRDPLDQKMVTFLIKVIPMNLDKIVRLMNQKEKQQFIQVITEVLNEFENPNGTFQKIVKQLMMLLQMVYSAVQDQDSQHFLQFKQAKWIIIFYKLFEQNYSSQRRRVLYKICHLNSIKRKFKNSIGILKLVQSENIEQAHLLGKIRALHVTYNRDPKKKFQLQDKQDSEINREIDHELNRIHLFQLKDKYDKIPLIVFDKMTTCPPKRVVSLLFSGFMSEDTCKVQEWGGLINTIYDSQIYSIRWESKSYGSILDFAVETVKDVAQANLKIGLIGSIGGPYLRAIAIVRQLYKKYHANPFNPAFQSALKTGQYLAQFIIGNFKNHFINLVGFSLGTQLIKSTMSRLAQKNCLHMINKVYLMGGLSDKTEFQNVVRKSKSPLTIINMFSEHDNVLKYLLKCCKPSIVPIGLNQLDEIEGHNIRNRDCSVIIKGHLQYRDHLNLLAKLFNMKDD